MASTGIIQAIRTDCGPRSSAIRSYRLNYARRCHGVLTFDLCNNAIYVVSRNHHNISLAISCTNQFVM
ncbi:MAG: hypothetical protein E5299_01784 [Burkholderia gladioli]|nr:MAG: hypothetical protein E5299_01784 [Burkholderia gladioli]